jgi:hypothetical protein
MKATIRFKCAEGHTTELHTDGSLSPEYLDSLTEVLRMSCNEVQEGCVWPVADDVCGADVEVDWEET